MWLFKNLSLLLVFHVRGDRSLLSVTGFIMAALVGVVVLMTGICFPDAARFSAPSNAPAACLIFTTPGEA